jgi:hypothetical protein
MGSMMVDNGSEPNAGEGKHRETYESFMSITKWAVGLIAVLLILLALFLVR